MLVMSVLSNRETGVSKAHVNRAKWRYAVLLFAAISTQSLAANDPAPEPAASLKFNILLRQPSPPVCEQSNSDEIVVCAANPEDQEKFRLRSNKDEEKFSKGSSKAEMALSENATLLAEGEAANLGSGVQSNRAMVRLKIKF